MKNKPEFIIIHHSLVSRDKNHEQFDAVKLYHVRKGWRDIAYHFFIEPDGMIKKGRDISAIGAHCKEERMNFRSIGICLAGDFDKENPTPDQMISLQKLIAEHKGLKIAPHREFAKYKSCPGLRLSDKIISQLTMTEKEIKGIKAVIAQNSYVWLDAPENVQKILSATNNKLRKIIKAENRD